MKFQGTDTYVAGDDLKLAVNAAITLERPLLIKGEPGTGKTLLAEEVARSLGMPLYQWHIKSTTKAQQGLYEYDAVSRLRDSQLGDARVGEIANYIVKGVLWRAFESPEQAVVLVDEIDKADIEFPNDLLRSQGHQAAIPPLHGALLKNEQDVHLFEQILFMQRRGK
jgi:MoxR-like ATPase